MADRLVDCPRRRRYCRAMRISAGSCEIEVEVAGNAGPALVLVHGLGGSSRTWSPLAGLLARSARVHAVNLRGCGGSSRGAEAWTLARAADDVEAVTAALGLASYVAVGHSLGGVIVQELIVRRPPAVRAAVLISTSSSLNQKATENWRRLADIVEARGLSDSPASQARGFAEDFAASHPDVVAEQASMAAATDPKVYAEQARAASSYDYTNALGRVACPVLVLQGLADRLTPPGGSVLLHRALPTGARLEMIEGAGHNLPIEMPERVAGLILEFAESVSAA